MILNIDQPEPDPKKLDLAISSHMYVYFMHVYRDVLSSPFTYRLDFESFELEI